MRTNANWCVRTWALALVLAMVFMALSCGGSGGASIDLSVNDGQGAVGSAAMTKSTGLVVTEEEIATLPAWQQEMLSDYERLDRNTKKAFEELTRMNMIQGT